MGTLTVWKFNTPDGAERAIETLLGLQKQNLITVLDGATVTWEEGKKKPKTRQLNELTGAGALTGSFWGLLFGLIFFVPLIGLAVGATMGAIAGSMADVGIDDDFIKSARENVVPGTSALFVMTSDAVMDKVKEAFQGEQFELISTNLSNEEESKLRAAFADD